jgi:hypothetical protein
MSALKNVEGYGIIGGHDQKELEPEKAVLNSQNEWEKQLKEYLLSGRLQGGIKAIQPRNRPQSPRMVSGRQQAATQRR